MVHLTVRGEILNIRTSIAPYTNEFRLGKLEKSTNIPGSITGITAWLISTNGPSPPRLLPLPKSGTLDPSSKEAKSKVVTPPFVRQALTCDSQSLSHLSARYEVMGSPPVLD